MNLLLGKIKTGTFNSDIPDQGKLIFFATFPANLRASSEKCCGLRKAETEARLGGGEGGLTQR